MNDVGQVVRHSKCIQNKNKTPSPIRSSGRMCVCEHMSMSEYANFLRHYDWNFSTVFRVISLCCRFQQIQDIENHSFESYSSGKEMDTHSHQFISSVCASLSLVWAVYLFKWIETKFRNSLWSGKSHHLIATFTMKLNPSQMNEFTHETPI